MELNNYAPHLFNSPNEYKSRNILSLADRVEVIREYDRQIPRPSLQKLANKYDCSSKQIKNILVNRETILQTFQNGGGSSPYKEDVARDDVLLKRQDKIAFLGKVMYEYIQRVLYFNCTIDDEKVRQKALQIKECIAVENFQPTNAWLEDFKMTYGIPSFDLATLRNNIVITESKRPHLSAIDMIQYVSRMEQEDQQDQPRKSYTPNNSDINGNAQRQRSSMNGRNEPKIVYEVVDDDDDELQNDDELQKLQFNSSKNQQLNVSSKSAKRRPASPFSDIESVDEALKHLKVLEDYAMMSDNYRAIGLLTQLEQVFKKQPKKK